VLRGQQPGDDLRVIAVLAPGHSPDRVDELGAVEDPVLQQVADRAGSLGEQFAGVELLHILGQDQDWQSWVGLAGSDRGAQALVR